MLFQWTIEKKKSCCNSKFCHFSYQLCQWGLQMTSGFWGAPLQFSILCRQLELLHMEKYNHIMLPFLAKSGEKSTEQRIQIMC